MAQNEPVTSPTAGPPSDPATAPPGPRPTSPAALLATLVAVFVFFIGGTYAGHAVVWARVLTWLGAATILFGWLLLALRRPAIRPTGPLPLAILVATACFGLSALGSARPRLSFEPTLIGLGTSLLFLMLLGLLRAPGPRWRAGSLVIVLAAAVAFGYLGEVLIEWLNWWALVGRVTQPPLRPNWAGLTFGSPNLVATALLLLAPLATVLVSQRAGRLAAAVLAAAAAAAIFLTGSRGGYIGVGAELLVGLGLVAVRLGRAESAVAPAITVESAIRVEPGAGADASAATAPLEGRTSATDPPEGRTTAPPTQPPTEGTATRVAADPREPGATLLGRRLRAGIDQPLLARTLLGRRPGTKIDQPLLPRWLLGVGAASVVIAVVAAGPALLARFATGGLEGRLSFWRTAIATFLDHPLTGGGPGTWPQLRYAYLGPDDPTYAVPHTHNLYLQIPAELGLVGTAGLTLAVLVFARVWWRRWSSSEPRPPDTEGGTLAGAASPGERGPTLPRPTPVEAAAVLAGLAGLGGQSLVDNLVNLPGISLAVALLVGWVGAGDGAPGTADGAVDDATGPRHRATDGRLALAGAVALGATLAAAAPFLARAELAAHHADTGNTAANAGDWAVALAAYETALALDPDHTLYQLERGVALAHLGRLAEARDAYARAVPIDLLPENAIALATLQWQLGETEAAVALAKDAFHRGARSALVALNAGRIFEATGHLDEAAEAYATALADEPALGRSSYWQEPERRLALVDLALHARTIVLLREPTDHGRAALLLAYAGLGREPAGEVEAVEDADARAFLGLVVAGIGGDEGAIAELRARAIRDPLDFDAVGWSARFAGAAGDPDAGRLRTWAAILRQDAADGVVFERSVVPAPPTQRVLGTVANYPFAVYQRPPPLDLLPPQVLVIGARLAA